MVETGFQTGFGQYELKRLHHHPKSPLRAWDAADELVLAHLDAHRETLLPESGEPPRVLIVNDACGALAVALHRYHPVSWNDHYSSQRALVKNLERNHLPVGQVVWLPGDQVLTGTFDLVIIKLPKNLSLLQHQIYQISRHLAEGAKIVGAGMVKHMTGTMIDVFDEAFANTQTTLARKKARLILAEQQSDPAIIRIQPVSPTQYALPGTPLSLINEANVFSRVNVDIGTRFFIEHFPALDQARRVVDLGCGNGALGLFAAWKHPAVELCFLEDSWLALKSARASFEASGLTNTAHFIASDAFLNFPSSLTPVDAVLCNPPFHEGTKVHTQIALRMFREASQVLSPGGTLHVVANRHLNYHAALKKWFRNVVVEASNRKFVVIRCE